MKITLIGAGNVAYHLGKRLKKKGFIIEQVFSRKLKNAQYLAEKVGGTFTNDLSLIDAHSELYIIAISDDYIGEIASKLAENKDLSGKLIVHTSGAVKREVLAPFFKNCGVFYPLQTFSKKKKVKFANIPICLDAEEDVSLQKLAKVAHKISKNVHYLTDKDRAILHVAAVMVNNFTNHLFHLAHHITQTEKIDFSILMPLIQETVLKLEDNTPFEAQTGPARRGDHQTIKKHLKYLQKFPEYTQLYTLLTKSIEHAYRR